MTRSSFDMKTKLSALKSDAGRINFRALFNSVSFYIPSAFLIVLGLVAFTNPALLGVIVASMFLFFGAIFACLTWRVLQWKRKVENVFKQFGGQFVVQTYAMPKEEDSLRMRRSPEDKKIIIH